jgi:hypothetical protein
MLLLALVNWSNSQDLIVVFSNTFYFVRQLSKYWKSNVAIQIVLVRSICMLVPYSDIFFGLRPIQHIGISERLTKVPTFSEIFS